MTLVVQLQGEVDGSAIAFQGRGVPIDPFRHKYRFWDDRVLCRVRIYHGSFTSFEAKFMKPGFSFAVLRNH